MKAAAPVFCKLHVFGLDTVKGFESSLKGFSRGGGCHCEAEESIKFLGSLCFSA